MNQQLGCITSDLFWDRPVPVTASEENGVEEVSEVEDSPPAIVADKVEQLPEGHVRDHRS